MVGESPTGIDLLTPVGEVRVLAVLLRDHRRGSACSCRRRCPGPSESPWKPLQIRDAELRHEVRVLTERAGLTRPARLGRQVERRVQGGADADGGILLAGDVGEAPHRLRVAQRSEAERLGPLREGPGGEGDADVLDEGVPRVRRDRHRYAVWRALGERLHRVAPPGRQSRVAEGVHVEVAEVLVEHHGARRGLADGARLLDHRPVRPRLDDRLEHQTDLLRQGESAQRGPRPAPPPGAARPRRGPCGRCR